MYYFCIMWRLIKIDNRTYSDTSALSKIEAGCILCKSGELILNVDGIERIVKSGQLFIYPPYAKVVICEATDFSGMVCEVDHAFVLSAMKSIAWSPKLQFISNHPTVALSGKDEERITQLIDFIAQSNEEDGNQLRGLLLDCLWKALTYEVLQAYIDKVAPPTGERSSRDSIVVSFQSDLKTDAACHRDVSHYARLQGLTPRYFSTAIRELTGHPPLYWITRAVIAEAQTLMSDSTLSLKEITFRLNFSSQTFFSRWYRQYAGETPTQFRKRNRINSD